MISPAQKDQMKRFVAERLLASGLYEINEGNGHLLVAERQAPRITPKITYVMLHQGETSAERIEREEQENRINGIYTSHVFFGDFRTYLKPVAQDFLKKNRERLKDYPDAQRRRIIELGDIERLVLKDTFPPELVYYVQDPKSQDPESIRALVMRSVTLRRTRTHSEVETPLEYRIPTQTIAILGDTPTELQFYKRNMCAIFRPYQPRI